MKNRRLALVAFLLCACMIVGVGYAALAVQLTIDGTVAFHDDANTELNQKVHFTGNVTILDANDKVVNMKDTQVVTADATSGDTTATLAVNFVGRESKDVFYTGTQHKVTVWYEFEIIAAAGEKLTVNIGDLAINGAVGTLADFSVVSKAVQIVDGKAENIAGTKITLEGTTEAQTVGTYRLEVEVVLNTQNVAEGSDVEATAFQIVLPVTKVETTTNE